MVRKQPCTHRHVFVFCACIVIASVLVCGCSRFQVRSGIEEADALFSRGNYEASLRAYEQILATYPQAGDRALFEMGIIHAYPKNERKDYQKALDCFERLIRDYPGSTYRLEAERMILHITNVTLKDRRMEEQQALIESLRKEVNDRDDRLAGLAQKVEALERKVFLMEQGPADRILIEKKERRLTLFAKGRVLKSYRIALGGNPEGPKERQGDNKTPEGIYFIDARNRDSRYHLSLHISYPNERDRKRARELGVPPGGDIMIHGIKNGFSAVGDLHAAFDWTKGCIAVTDEEIEEIERLAPNGTIVEIRP
ncbi:MAG TPA: L,D-transpeptidase family protein [Deltaproteobacteria bacterium]|nr:L,D-transpeptidase family protein [Deltaproteobacteria bacterium]